MRKSEYPAADIINWDISNWSRALDYWDSHLPASLSGLDALEVGARDGGLALFMALKGANVVCSDLDGPTEQALEVHKKYGVAGRIVDYAKIDVTAIDFADETFDIVAFKSLLGGVGRGGAKARQQMAIDEIYRVLKPNGILLFAENLQGTAAHMFARRKYTRWGDTWRYVTVDEVKEYMVDFSALNYKTFGYFGAFGRNERQKGLLAKCDRRLDPLLSESAKYIVYGCAKK